MVTTGLQRDGQTTSNAKWSGFAAGLLSCPNLPLPAALQSCGCAYRPTVLTAQVHSNQLEGCGVAHKVPAAIRPVGSAGSRGCRFNVNACRAVSNQAECDMDSGMRTLYAGPARPMLDVSV